MVMFFCFLVGEFSWLTGLIYPLFRNIIRVLSELFSLQKKRFRSPVVAAKIKN